MISDNIKDVLCRIEKAAARVGRNAHEIRLIAVSKGVGLEAIKNAVQCGVLEFGENRVKEAAQKQAAIGGTLPGAGIVWHMIGHLQSNKAKVAVRLFDLIHSVDSVGLASAINRHAGEEGKIQRVLIEVKLSKEERKFGVGRDDLESVVSEVVLMKNIRLEGLMTMPPFFEDPQMTRPYYKELRSIRDMLKTHGYDTINELSMGMSHDFEIAVEEGATMVRVGTSLFGQRK